MPRMARIEALVKALMKPKFTPIFLKMTSLYSLWRSMMLDIFISLKVLREAVVFFDCLRRSATRKRMRFILTCTWQLAF